MSESEFSEFQNKMNYYLRQGLEDYRVKMFLIQLIH
jgi:hypothetical protein